VSGQLPIRADLLQENNIPARQRLRLRAFGRHFSPDDGACCLWSKGLDVEDRDAEVFSPLGLLGPKRLDVSPPHSDVGLWGHQDGVFRVHLPHAARSVFVERLRELIG